jgi:SAM-dependent methyltransferase
VKARALRILQRLRLLGPAYAAYERLQALRGGGRAAEDGLPVPPPRLRVRVAGTADLDWFLRSGRLAEQSIRAALERHQTRIEELESVLDFGCGCGRVVRRWHGLGGIHGSDTSGDAIDWCRRNLSFARFETNALEPPLAFAAASFDLVYALSVFTHLTVELQRAWLTELARVLRPDGLLLLTTHGAAYEERLSPEERTRFRRGEVVVRWAQVEGTNLCAAYHPPGALESLLPPQLTFLEREPEGALGNPRQDVNLMRKKR